METNGISRRQALAALGALAGSAWAACARPHASVWQPAPRCVLTPELTEGPFFVDRARQRSDLTLGTRDPGVTEGLPLTLMLSVFRVDGGGCRPLTDARVDVWHASALGLYSAEADQPMQDADTSREDYLRGYQVTDGAGRVAFRTIYPGWYQGRTPHIHFKIRAHATQSHAHELTSQLFFDDAVSDGVFRQGVYARRGQRDITNADDGIYLGETMGPPPGMPPGGAPFRGPPPKGMRPPSGGPPPHRHEHHGDAANAPGKQLTLALRPGEGGGYRAQVSVGVKVG